MSSRKLFTSQFRRLIPKRHLLLSRQFYRSSRHVIKKTQNQSKWTSNIKFYFGIVSVMTASSIFKFGKRALAEEDNDGKKKEIDDFFASTKPKKATIKILVLDGGGLRGCMSVQILKALEKKISQYEEEKGIKPEDRLKLCNAFDFIVGTSTGGLIALGLGINDMTINQIDELYELVATDVFGKDAWIGKRSWDWIKGKVSTIGIGHALSTNDLENIFKDKFKNHKMIEPGSSRWKEQPFVAVIATMVNNYHLGTPVLIKNYDITTNNGYTIFDSGHDYHLPSICDCYIWEAARATTAAPTYFKPIEIAMTDKMKEYVIETKKLYKAKDKDKEKGNKQISDVYNNYDKLKFTDGGINSNAPCLFAFTEAMRLWPDCNIKMLAIGTGQPHKITLFDEVNASFVKTIFDTMFHGKELTTLVPLISFAYDNELDLQRMNPEFDADKLDMADWSQMGDINESKTKNGEYKWRDAGRKFAKEKEEWITAWAQFLVDHKDEKHDIVHMFEEMQKKYKQKRKKSE